MTNDEVIAIATARKNGKPIEKKFKACVNWLPMGENEEFDFHDYDYRVVNELPKTWEEYCKENYTSVGYLKAQMPFVGHLTQNGVCSEGRYYTKAFVAFAKLIMLRDCYNGYETPSKNGTQFFIDVSFYAGVKTVHCLSSQCIRGGERCHVLQFHTPELRDAFKANFEGLILEAAELLV